MFAHCKGPLWRVDDFSRCFEQDYLQTLFPLLTCFLSLTVLAAQLYFFAKRAKQHAGYQPLDQPGHIWSLPTGNQPSNGAPTNGVHSETEDEFERNEELALTATRPHAGVTEIQIDRPRGEFLLVALEELVVVGQLGVHIAVLASRAWGNRGIAAAVAGVIIWAYVTVLVSLRLLLSSNSKITFPTLWYHTAAIYCLMWLFEVLIFRSALIHPISKLAEDMVIMDFSLTTFLALVALTSRKGNKPVLMEYEGDLKPAKEQTASLLSIVTFTWVDPIVWTGFKKTYEMADVWNLAIKDKASYVLSDYRQVKKTSSLAFHLLKYFKRGLILQALWAAFSGFLTFAPTLLLKAILEYVEDPYTTPRNAAWFYVILLFVSGCAAALADGQALWIGRKICIRLRAIIIGEIYAKALKRRAAAGADKVLGEKKKSDEPEPKGIKKMMTIGRRKKKTTENVKPEEGNAAESSDQVTSGTIINLMAVDSFKVSEVCAYLHFLWANTPVQVVVAVVLLYRILGKSSIAGIGMMIILLPINLFISKRFASLQKQILAATDARIHTTNEVLSNIRIIKYFAWEQRFMATVNEKRALELKHLRRRYILWAAAATVWSGAPVLITFLSFFVYTVIEGKDLIPSVAFTALSLFQILRIPLDQLADMVAHVQESKVSIDRIEEYLNEPETEKYKQLQSDQLDDKGNPLIGFENGTFSWGTQNADGEDDSFKLRDLSMKFQVGQVNVIVGPTGSGKTSLLMALLGEMSLVKGKVFLPGGKSREDVKPDPRTGLTETVAYCAQQPWLVNGTVKENIVFASEWDSRRYNDVIIACSLQRDLEILDNGDKTVVGEKGVTLSGGQKQRISLARALYSKARHVLLDDVLSAVDAHTAKWIFDQALLGPLMYNRTCVLVTHNVALCLPHSEFAVVLDNGRVVAQGTPDEVIDSGKLGEDVPRPKTVSRGPSRIASRVPSDVGGEEGQAANGHASAADKRKSVMSLADNQEEVKAVGGVKLAIIVLYLKAMGSWWYWAGAGAIFVAQQISSVTTNIWIREWANAYGKHEVSITGVRNISPVTHVGGISSLGSCLTSGTCIWNIPFFSNSSAIDSEVFTMTSQHRDVNPYYYLGIYAVLGIIFMVITLVREGVLFGGSLHASQKIHQQLMESVTHAKFRFFDSTPLGQLMNRFSKDIESVDQEIAPVAVGVVHCLASILTIVILISVITPGFLIAGLFITILYFLIGSFYINSSRDLKRLESIQRSPLYQQFGETLSGMTTIRAYGDERRFIRENLLKINTHSRPFIYLWAANRWLAFRVDVVGALVSFFAGVFVVLSVGKIDAGAAGLAMTYAVTFTENVLWFVRLYSANEQNMNSVERIKEYLDVEQEAPPIIPENRPPPNWPSKGAVEFINYSTRYRVDFDRVLKNITFKIAPGEKVGVVGRTGAGKSSLALALFRALEAEEGKIIVDEIDIGLIGLQDLRENIVMVPQDPTLFTGTVRSNLDPFGLFTDEEIFTALRRVQLIGAASSTSSSVGPSTPEAATSPNPMELATSPNAAVLGSSYGVVGATTHPASILPNTQFDNPETAEQPAVTIQDSSVASAAPNDSAENKNPFKSLSSPITESGSNLSQGQRQLLCLARALLKNPKVLLMDEATASIDYATDAKIQETIREIRNTTITIAHRLQTIIDYDKVLVLDKGEVVEYGHPWELLRKEEGTFRGMCQTSGELENLEKEAKKAWDAKKLVDDE